MIPIYEFGQWARAPLLAAFAGVLGASCAPHSAAQVNSVHANRPEPIENTSSFRPLMKSEFMSRVIGSSIPIGKEGSFDGATSEVFHSRGRYRAVGGRVVVSGSYKVDGNHVCVAIEDIDKLTCRRFYKDRFGTIYMTFDHRPGTVIVSKSKKGLQ